MLSNPPCTRDHGHRFELGRLLEESFIVEFMFAIPGLGRMGVDAVFARDFPVLQVVLVVVALNVLLVNLLVDLLYGVLDLRVRVQR